MRSRLNLALQLSTNMTEVTAKLEDAKKRQEEALRALNGANARVQMLSRDLEDIKKNESFMTEVIFSHRVKQHSSSVI